MTEQFDIKETWFEIQAVAGAQGQGGPEWQLQGRWPWTPARNQGGDKVWINREAFPQINIDTRGRFAVEVKARSLKKMSEAKQLETGNVYFDGTLDWMWQFDIIQFLDHDPVSNTPAPIASSNGASQEEFRRSKQECRLTDCIQALGSFFANEPTEGKDLELLFLAGVSLYEMVTVWEERRLSGPAEEPPWEGDPRGDRAPDNAPELPRMAVQAEAIARELTAGKAPAGILKKLDAAILDEDGDPLYAEEDLLAAIQTFAAGETRETLTADGIKELIRMLESGEVESSIAIFV